MLHRVDFTCYKIFSYSSKNANVKTKVGIVVAINWVCNKLAVSSTQHFQSNWECSFKVTLIAYFRSLRYALVKTD